ncbi:mannose-1-phosphate guanylyltransferase [Alteriqipengyuania lutimaris]|uniref:Mannose-1-phosphate guanylyltransferase n=1 Tax=Alteriqipengyuania lutimaris TaxID=1538146 RepID=A0A395LJC5_9SPHN|nr:sugar phosphate nucleotidyltransferase [Alteriqipengyuania lutimaris]MBB3034328.1 mannose-1-phosphate guanylyltransferase/mannose-6-phosphate isomerase [Alteriqipengyuania lutimaris]RDS76769.1 mannose-1-phosphate guanylyltransferase [Alteriqipengyuania lutimaris]
MAATIQPVILCGGGGTRLWPRSRRTKPKPFLPLLGERTLFQQALERVADDALFRAPIVVAGEAHISFIREQGGESLSIIAEPVGRNTAPAIALAALRAPEGSVLLVCPSDHHIADEAAFRAAAAAAAELARKNHLVSFGIEAASPHTGYGYLKRGDALDGGYALEAFVEKPDLETAKAFLADGRYSWNGGIFAFGREALLDELRTHRPEMARLCEAAVEEGALEDGIFTPAQDQFARIDGDSIDYAVMENTDRAAMVPVSMGWSDIGNWDALREARGCASSGPHELLDSTNAMVDSDGPRVSVVGLDDVIVIVDGDDILVTNAKGAQSVGKLEGVSR